MEITVNLGAIDLNTVIGQTVIVERDDDGDRSEYGEARTIGDCVIDALVEKLSQTQFRELTNWSRVGDLVTARIRELVDAQVGTIIADLIETGIVQPTSRYGEPKGAPVSLRELIITAGTTWATSKSKDTYGSATNMEALIAKNVESAMRTELAKTITEAKVAVQKRVAGSAATVLAEAVKDALR
jgi:hypothetical protein